MRQQNIALPHCRATDLMGESFVHSLIQHWGFAPDTEMRVDRVIESGVAGHAPKYVFSVGPTQRLLFLGNAGRLWPSTERVDARLSALERSALAHPFGIGPSVLVPPVRTLNGAMTVVHEEVRYYLTSHISGCTLAEAVRCKHAHREGLMLLLAAATGAFHACANAAGKGTLPMDDAATFWRDATTRCRKDFGDLAANRCNTSHLAGKWDPLKHCELARQAVVVLTFIIEDSSGRLTRLQALPATWNHGDLQMKNVMVDMSKASCALAASAVSGTLDCGSLPPASLAVIDVTDGAYCSRLYDLFFLLAGGMDDAVDEAFVVDRHAVNHRFRAYFDAGGQPFSEEEILLLINACTIKGLTVAQYYIFWSPDSNALALFEQAVRAALFICGPAKDDIRAAIREAQTEHRRVTDLTDPEGGH